VFNAGGGSGSGGGSTASADFANGGGSASGSEGANGDGVSAMGSPDPDDYFARINIDESLFKKVERRYTDQAENWALADAKGGARRLASDPAMKKLK
jgi:hypothetical protein